MKRESLSEFRSQVATMTPPEMADLIDSLGYTIWWQNHEAADGRIPNTKEIDRSNERMQKRIEIAAEIFAKALDIDFSNKALVKQMVQENLKKFKEMIRKRWQQCLKLGTIFSVTYKNHGFFADGTITCETALGPYRHLDGQPKEVNKYLQTRTLGSSAAGRESIIIFGLDNDVYPPGMYGFDQHSFNKYYRINDLPPKFTGTGLVSPSITKVATRSIRGSEKESFVFVPKLFRYSGPREEIRGVFDPMCIFEKMYPRGRKKNIPYDDGYFMDFAVIARQIDRLAVAEFTIHDMPHIEILNMPSIYCTDKKEEILPTSFYGGKVF
ncbi:MAG: hypothetical protein ABIA11_04085 [Patescibacteria group bacterium]|nr:hypothetical protein [Patescibacteria group bacterium]